MTHYYFGRDEYDDFDIKNEKVSKGMLKNKQRRRGLIIRANQTGPKIEKSTIEEAKYGLFADKDYKEYEFVTFYGGKLVDKGYSEGDSYWRKDTPFSIPASLALDETAVIDGAYGFNMITEKGRWINAALSDTENVMFQYYDYGKVRVLTTRDVKKGEEFFYDYSKDLYQMENFDYDQRNKIGQCASCGARDAKLECLDCNKKFCNEKCAF